MGEPVLATSSDGVLGPYLVDGSVRALYLRQAVDGESQPCDEARCALVWPRVVVRSLPSAEDSIVRADLIGVTRHSGETLQATYDGQPLFYYAPDGEHSATGEYRWIRTLGQAIHDEWGKWFLVTPEGDSLERILHLPESP